MEHRDKIRFHNAIVDLANIYMNIAKALNPIAAELCSGECMHITECRVREILNRIPSLDTDAQEAAVEEFRQRYAMPPLSWEHSYTISLDQTVQFGVGYDFFGLECLRREASGPNGNYLMWPNGGKWTLYRDTDGAMAFEQFSSREECERAAEQWCSDITGGG